jgi:outer membrane receptor for ferric coprogen and ferric-rhodotorulic acid
MGHCRPHFGKDAAGIGRYDATIATRQCHAAAGFGQRTARCCGRGAQSENVGRIQDSVDCSRDSAIRDGDTYTDAQLLDDQDSVDQIASPFPSIAPKHTVKLWSSYTFPGVLHGLTMGGGLTLFSPTDAVRYGIDVHQGTYTVVDASLGYAFTKKTSLTLNVNNLFNRDYFAGAYSRGLQRIAMFTLRTGF